VECSACGEHGSVIYLKSEILFLNEEIHHVYQECDMFIFASSVETISNILLEAMAAGRPIAYSNIRPMTDILGNDGVQFENENILSIANAIEKLLCNDNARYTYANAAYQRALNYTWTNTAKKTFAFLKAVASNAAKGAKS